MSTTFGIRLTGFYADGEFEDIEIARRVRGGIWFTNPLAHLLRHDIEVIPLDNTAQGIYTIGDIKKAIDESN